MTEEEITAQTIKDFMMYNPRYGVSPAAEESFLSQLYYCGETIQEITASVREAVLQDRSLRHVYINELTWRVTSYKRIRRALVKKGSLCSTDSDYAKEVLECDKDHLGVLTTDFSIDDLPILGDN